MKLFCEAKSKSEKLNNMYAKKVSLQIMLNFAEGKITTEQFWEAYINNELIGNELIKDKKRPHGCYYRNKDNNIIFDKDKHGDLLCRYNPDNIREKFDMKNFESRVELFRMVVLYFTRRKSTNKFYNDDFELFNFWADCRPEWADYIIDETVIRKIKGYVTNSGNKKKLLLKEIISALFKYDIEPPKWINVPQWPINDGKPLIFSHQESCKDNNEHHEIYYFYDSETNNKMIVEQSQNTSK